MFNVNNVTEIRKAYQAAIKTVVDRVFYDDSPPDTTPYPFVVFELFDSTADGSATEVFDLYIDGWDNDSDTTVLEGIMFDITNLIDKQLYSDVSGELSFRAELEKKMLIRDPDVQLKHRQYRFTVRSIQRRS
jgi:hypothetical protein